MSLTIYMAKHGETKRDTESALATSSDSILTSKGVYEARQLAHKIDETAIIFDRIYSASLLSSYAAAVIINEIFAFESPTALSLDRLPKGNMLLQANPYPTQGLDGDVAADEEMDSKLLAWACELIDSLQKVHFASENLLLVFDDTICKIVYAAFYKLRLGDVLKEFSFQSSELIILSREIPPSKALMFSNNIRT